MFEMPESDKQVGPPEMLYNLMAVLRPNPGDRFKLGLLLAQSCLQLHSSQWLHKESRTQRMLFFPKEEQRPLQIPIPGWLSVGEDARTGPRQATEIILSTDSDLYAIFIPRNCRVPAMKWCLIITLSAAYCLNEIALWTALKALFEKEQELFHLKNYAGQMRWKRNPTWWALLVWERKSGVINDNNNRV